jgi:hypothetical protein
MQSEEPYRHRPPVLDPLRNRSDGFLLLVGLNLAGRPSRAPRSRAAAGTGAGRFDEIGHPETACLVSEVGILLRCLRIRPTRGESTDIFGNATIAGDHKLAFHHAAARSTI